MGWRREGRANPAPPIVARPPRVSLIAPKRSGGAFRLSRDSGAHRGQGVSAPDRLLRLVPASGASGVEPARQRGRVYACAYRETL